MAILAALLNLIDRARPRRAVPVTLADDELLAVADAMGVVRDLTVSAPAATAAPVLAGAR